MLRYFFTNDATEPVDKLIDKVLNEMHTVEVNSEEFVELTTKLRRLYDIKAENRSDPVSRDTLALIAGNLLGILLIVAYEQRHVMTSKGFSQIIRPKTGQ